MRRFVDSGFERELELSDGMRLHLRLLRPGDRARVVAAMRQLSDLSRYRRFLSATQELSDEALRYLTELDNENHLAIVAAEVGPRRGDETGLGLARFVRTAPGAKSAEAAVTVVDAHQGRGLGRLLLAALTLAARERGIESFQAEILESNQPMLTLLRRLGAKLDGPLEDGVLLANVPLPEIPAEGDWSALASSPIPLMRFAARELKLLAAPPK
jgi:RimJ/RimL family protein N-acetyltransferase